MGQIYEEFVNEFQSDWSSIDNIIDREDECDLSLESDQQLIDDAIANLKDLQEQAADAINRLTEIRAEMNLKQ